MDAPDSDLDMEMEDPHLRAAMGFPVTASLGPAGPLLRQLRSLTTVQNVVSEDEIQGLKEHLHGLCVSLMHHSEAEEPLSSTAKCWMREVRELCYDTKNYLDDAQFISKQDDDDDAQLTPEEKQENAQFEFKMLEARAKNASKRRQRYKIDQDNINKETTKLASTGRRLPLLHPELIDHGRMDKLATLLHDKEEKQLKVVSLVGLEGVGKTTLAKRIYHHVKTGGEFQCRAFVRVSPNPDIRRLLASVFTQIQLPPGFSSSSSSEGFTQLCCWDAQDLITNIQDYLRAKRYFIIIDDLWSTSVWDIIRRAFPDGGCHSRIITTTQFEDVASACCSYQSKFKFEIEPLKYDQSRKLFFGMVFGSEDKVSFPEGFREVSSEIIEKCGRLPLSMVNIASLLPTEESEINLEQWKYIRDFLPPTLKANPTSEGIEKVINLIYNNLSPELKTCLLYLAMYQEGYTNNKDDLVKQWVTEGFTGEGENKEETARENFDELVSRGMIQPVDINYRGVLSCTLHHTVHSLIVKKSMEGNFVIGVDNFQSLPNKVRRLSVQFGGARSAQIPMGITLSEVRSLAFFGFYGCAGFIEECKLLRVLILHVWANQDKVPFDLSGISTLLPLRYVKIAGNIAVKLPAEIQELQYLETLEVDTPVVTIPSGIGKLSRLSSLKVAVRLLSREDICILQALPALSALSLHVWTTPLEMIVFNKGEFLVLKSFEFRCPVPWLKFEAGSMSDLRNLNLCFNAREADQHGIVPIGMEHLSGLKEITAHIWGSDTDVGSTFRTAISNHPCNPRVYMQLVDPIFHGDTTTSVGTRVKVNMSKDDIKVEDEKKQAADIRMFTLPQSKRMSTLLGSSSCVPVQGTDKKIKLEIETDGIEVKAETKHSGSSSRVPDSGEKKAVNSELWHACSGPLVAMPPVGSHVVYFPQGHCEQVAALMHKVDTIPNYPSLPSKLVCKLLSLTLHADSDTDEAYAQMTLQPVKKACQYDPDAMLASDLGLKQNNQPAVEFFCKTLTASDTSTHSGFSIPRRAAKKIFPPLDFTMQPPAQELMAKDLHDIPWGFRHIFRGTPKRHLLTTGWSVFVSAKRLLAGDSVLFIRDEKSQLLLGIRRATRPQPALPSSVLSSDSMGTGILAAAAHATANSGPFTILYNPRASPSEFAIPLAKYNKALHTQVSLGTRFRMLFETEESGVRSYMGTITGIGDLDPVRWKNSHWRNLQVCWDEPTASESRTRVSIWEIEPVATPSYICPQPFFRPKLHKQPGMPDDESEVESAVRAMRRLADDLAMQQNPQMLPAAQPPYLTSGAMAMQDGMGTGNEDLMRRFNVQGQNIGLLNLQVGSEMDHPVMAQRQQQQVQPSQQSSAVQQQQVQFLQQNAIHLLQQLQRQQSLPQQQLKTAAASMPSLPHAVSQAQMLSQIFQPYSSQVQQVGLSKSPTQRPGFPGQTLQLQQEAEYMQALLQGQQQQFTGSLTPQRFVRSHSALAESEDPSASCLSNVNSLSSTAHEWSKSFTDMATSPHIDNLLQEIQSKPDNRNKNDMQSSKETIPVPNRYPVSDQLDASSAMSVCLDGNAQVDPRDNFLIAENVDSLMPDAQLSRGMASGKDICNLPSVQRGHREVENELYSAASSSQSFKPGCSGDIAVNDSGMPSQGLWNNQTQRMRTFTTVQKRGSVGRSIDITRYTNYDELRHDLACMFGIQGQLEDPYRMDWKLVYVDHEDDILLLGNDPWEEFVNCVKSIKILSSIELEQMSLKGDFGGIYPFTNTSL